MSTPASGLPYDPANPLLASVVSRLDSGVIALPDGTRAGVLTVRTAACTVTVLLGAGDLDAWSAAIADIAAQVRGAGNGVALPSLADMAKLGRLK